MDLRAVTLMVCLLTSGFLLKSAYTDTAGDLLSQAVFTVKNMPGIFTDMLKQCHGSLPWLYITVNGTTLTKPEDRKSLGKLSKHFSSAITYINIYDSPDVGAVIADIIRYVPDLENIQKLTLEPGILYTEMAIPTEGEKRTFTLCGFFDPSILTYTTTQFIDHFMYGGEVDNLELKKITSTLLPQPAVLEPLLRQKTGAVWLDFDTRPSHVFSSLIQHGGRVKWKELWLWPGAAIMQKVVDRKDRHTIDQLRKKNILSEKCELIYGFDTVVPWIPGSQRYDWSKTYNGK